LKVAFDRIAVDYRIMGGVPCIKGTRIPVATVLAMLAEGMSVEATLADFPQLTNSDVGDALRFAAAVIDEGEVPLRPAG
jgi:uncharacterized protein (DUF433 family)